MDGQDTWRRRYQQRRPEWSPSAAIYQRLVDERVGPDGGLLDIGCGHTDAVANPGTRARFAIGVDRDRRALVQSPSAGGRVAADAERLPFTDGSFHVVVMAWVFEHLERPRHVLREVHRVLEPGGSLVFVTPNALNYNVWLIRSVPNALHGYLTRKLYGRSEDDTYPTRYRLNSVRRIDRLLSELGFGREHLILNGDPTYAAVNAPLFKLACFVEHIYDVSWLQRARVHLIGAYRKPTAGSL